MSDYTRRTGSGFFRLGPARKLDAEIREQIASERIEPGAEAAHRDDLARDVALEWLAQYEDNPCLDRPLRQELINALDRLGDAYGVFPSN